MIVAIEKSSPFGVSDASRAIQSMVLTAWSEGVGSNWTGWVGMTQVATLLGVPESVDVIAVIPFGYPAYSRTQGKKRRKNLSEIAHQERFGKPFGLSEAVPLSNRLIHPPPVSLIILMTRLSTGAHRCLT
mgnify:CR=1 FL=1